MKSGIHKRFMKVVDSLVKKKLKENPHIELVLLGGSVARGDESEHSDIDINFYVKKKYFPSFPRKFYKYKGKFIEEIFVPMKEFSSKVLFDEILVLYDKNNITNNMRKELSIKEKNKIFKSSWKKAKEYQRLAEDYYNKEDYEKSIYHILGSESLVHIFCMALPARLNLPFPSFRLLKTIKKISKIYGDNKIYHDCIKLFRIKNVDKKKVLKKYEKAYKIISKCYKNKNPNEKNLGFYDNLKIKYNIEGLDLTFKEYPPEFALKFIIGCIIDWSLDEKDLWKLKENKKYKNQVIKLTKEILNIQEFNKEFAKQRLDLSKDLEKRIDKIIKCGFGYRQGLYVTAGRFSRAKKKFKITINNGYIRKVYIYVIRGVYLNRYVGVKASDLSDKEDT